jgi:hypothetical protein
MQMRNKKRTMGINKIGLLPQQPFVVSQSGAAASSGRSATGPSRVRMPPRDACGNVLFQATRRPGAAAMT